MRGMRSSCVWVDHLLTVTVVGGNDRCSFNSLDCANEPAQTCIEGFDRADCRTQNAGVPNHIGIGEVDDVNVMIALIDGPANPIGYFESAHFRLQIVSRYLG